MIKDNFDVFYSKFKSLGKKYSLQQEYLLKLMFKEKKHLSAFQISKKIQQEYSIKISKHTVYNILNFLEEINIVTSVLNKKTKQYELNLNNHHDHLICTNCGKIVEFYDVMIENEQKLIYKKYDFQEIAHNMILYGICNECQHT